jgi:hypothetical protein
MKLNELREASYRAWAFMQELEEIVVQPKNFRKETRK